MQPEKPSYILSFNLIIVVALRSKHNHSISQATELPKGPKKSTERTLTVPQPTSSASSLIILLSYHNGQKSKISYCRSPPHQYGHDWLLSNDDPTSRLPTSEYAQIRSRGEEAGVISGAEAW